MAERQKYRKNSHSNIVIQILQSSLNTECNTATPQNDIIMGEFQNFEFCKAIFTFFFV